MESIYTQDSQPDSKIEAYNYKPLVNYIISLIFTLILVLLLTLYVFDHNKSFITSPVFLYTILPVFLSLSFTVYFQNLLGAYNNRYLAALTMYSKELYSEFSVYTEKIKNRNRKNRSIAIFSGLPELHQLQHVTKKIKIEHHKILRRVLSYFCRTYYCTLENQIDNITSIRPSQILFQFSYQELRELSIEGHYKEVMLFISTLLLPVYRELSFSEIIIITQNRELWKRSNIGQKNSFIYDSDASILILENHLRLQEILKLYFSEIRKRGIVILLDVNTIIDEEEMTAIFRKYEDIALLRVKNRQHYTVSKAHNIIEILEGGKIKIEISNSSSNNVQSESFLFSSINKKVVKSLQSIDKCHTVDAIVDTLKIKERFVRENQIKTLCKTLRNLYPKLPVTYLTNSKEYIINQVIGNALVEDAAFYVLILDFASIFSDLENTEFVQFFILLQISENSFAFDVISNYIRGELTRRKKKLQQYGYSNLTSYNNLSCEKPESKILLVFLLNEIKNPHLIDLIKTVKLYGAKIGVSAMVLTVKSKEKQNNQLFVASAIFSKAKRDTDQIVFYEYKGKEIGMNQLKISVSDNIVKEASPLIESELYALLKTKAEINDFTLKNNRELEFLSLIKGKLTLKEVLATDTQNSKSIMDIAVIKELYSGTMVSPIGVISDYFRNLHSLMLLDLEYNDFIQFKSIPLCHFDIITSLVLTFLYTHTEEEIAIHIVSSDKKLCKQLEQQTEAISSHEINFYKFSELMLINTKNKKSHLIVFDAFNLNIDHLNIINLVKYTIFNLDAKAVLFVDKKHVAESVSKVATSEKMRFDNIEVKNRNEFSITAIINGINCNIALPYFLYEKKDLDSLDRRRANQLMIEIE